MSEDLVEKKPEPVDAVHQLAVETETSPGIVMRTWPLVPVGMIAVLAMTFDGIDGFTPREAQARDAMHQFVKAGLEATGAAQSAKGAVFPDPIAEVRREGNIYRLSSYVECKDPTGQRAALNFEIAVRDDGESWSVESLTLPNAMAAPAR